MLKVLSKPIPAGGRNITSHEAKQIRAAGYPCSPHWRVMPDGSEYYGTLYVPQGYRHWYNAGVRATTK